MVVEDDGLAEGGVSAAMYPPDYPHGDLARNPRACWLILAALLIVVLLVVLAILLL